MTTVCGLCLGSVGTRHLHRSGASTFSHREFPSVGLGWAHSQMSELPHRGGILGVRHGHFSDSDGRLIALEPADAQLGLTVNVRLTPIKTLTPD